MTHHPYLERAAHILAAVALAVGLLCAVPVLDALSRAPEQALRELRPRRQTPALRAQEGELVARISIPRLSVDTPVYEGVQTTTMASGAGHVPGTALPGEEGTTNNSVIAVARDSAPAALGELAVGDSVQMRTRSGLKRYRVTQRRVVPPERVRFGATARPRVTFVTAYPPDSIGPAPLRVALILEPMAPDDAVAERPPSSAPRSAALRPPVRLHRPIRLAANSLSSTSRNSATRPTGRTETSTYSEASEALPEGK